MSRQLKVDELHDLAAGLQLLGSGGGGHPEDLIVAASKQLRSSPVFWAAPEDLDEDDLIAPIGYFGSISLMREKLPSGHELVDAIGAQARWSGRSPAALMPLEMAGENGISPIMAASMMGIPLIDADLSGRALSRLNQNSLTASGVEVVPCVVTEPGGQIVVLDGIDASQVEVVLRSVISRTSGWGALALRFLRVGDMDNAVLYGTGERALLLGARFSAISPGARPAEIAGALNGQLLGSGRIVDSMLRPGPSGFDNTTVTIWNSDTGVVLRIEGENGWVVAIRDGEVVCTTPTLLVLVATPTNKIITVGDVSTGENVSVISLAAPEWWLGSAERLNVVAPRSFGFDHEVVL